MPPSALSRADEVRAALRSLISRLRGERHDVAALFYDPATGNLRAEAVRWADQLASRNYVRSSAFHQDGREHAKREGRRELALEILASLTLDTKRLDSLTEQMRELNDVD